MTLSSFCGIVYLVLKVLLVELREAQHSCNIAILYCLRGKQADRYPLVEQAQYHSCCSPCRQIVGVKVGSVFEIPAISEHWLKHYSLYYFV